MSKVGDPANAPVLLLHGTTGSGKSMLSEGFAGALFGRAEESLQQAPSHRRPARAISLSPEGQHRAVELTRRSSCEIDRRPDPQMASSIRRLRPA